MGLIKCPDCEKLFSDRIDACPNCGCPKAAAIAEANKVQTPAKSQATVNEAPVVTLVQPEELTVQEHKDAPTPKSQVIEVERIQIIKEEKQSTEKLSMRWYNYITKVQPWMSIISYSILYPFIFMGIVDVISEGLYSEIELALTIFQAAVMIPNLVLRISLLSKAYKKTITIGTIKSYLIWEIIFTSLLSGNIFFAIVYPILGYFVWYKCNMKYFRKRLPEDSDNEPQAVDVVEDSSTGTTVYCSYCGSVQLSDRDICQCCGNMLNNGNSTPEMSGEQELNQVLESLKKQEEKENLYQDSVYTNSKELNRVLDILETQEEAEPSLAPKKKRNRTAIVSFSISIGLIIVAIITIMAIIFATGTEKGPEDYEFYNVGIRTITISPSEFNSERPSLDAYQKAQEIVNEWEDGEKSEKRLIAIFAKYGANQGGGKLDIAEPGEYVTEIDSWIFSSKRKVGDIAIIKNPYGYSICYISSFIEVEKETTPEIEIDDSTLTQLAEPQSGEVFEKDFYEEGYLPFEVKTSGDRGYYIYLDLIDLPSGKAADSFSKEYIEAATKLSFYVRGGDSVEFEIPPGTYEVYYATGEIWYGTEYLFGENTIYNKCSKEFLFEGYDGWTITLYPVSGGNLDTERISAGEFPK